MSEFRSKFLTITEAAETKIHLHPALTEVREIQLLNFHKPAFWFKFERI